jgi:hypothetical protein
VKGKKKIRRKPGVKRNMYFNADTQESIVTFQESECTKTKKKIYESEIFPAFDKLCENLIFVYGFKSPYSTFEELKGDCVSFLYESIYKWNKSKGTKAFSYFNVVAKNWLIINTRQHKKRRDRHVSVDAPELMSSSQKEEYESFQVVPPPDETLILRERKGEIINLLEAMKIKVSNDNEQLCIEAIQTLFSSIDDLDLLNKRAVLVYIREISGLEKKQMSKSMSIIRRHYRSMVKDKNLYDIF